MAGAIRNDKIVLKINHREHQEIKYLEKNGRSVSADIYEVGEGWAHTRFLHTLNVT